MFKHENISTSFKHYFTVFFKCINYVFYDVTPCNLKSLLFTGKWKDVADILEEEKSLALRKEGLGVVLDSQLPHLIGQYP